MNSSKTLFLACLLAVLTLAWPPVGRAQSQSEMNQQSLKEFEAADAKLNDVYKQLVARLDEQARTKLKTAQRAWIAFRDAQAELQTDVTARGGSMAPLMQNTASKELTQARIKELETLMKEITEH